MSLIKMPTFGDKSNNDTELKTTPDRTIVELSHNICHPELIKERDLMNAIYSSICSGSSIYVILLASINIISILTQNEDFYEKCEKAMKVMYGDTIFEKIDPTIRRQLLDKSSHSLGRKLSESTDKEERETIKIIKAVVDAAIEEFDREYEDYNSQIHF